MPPRIPRQPAERGPNRVELDARLSAELLSAMAGARRRAARDGDRQIDTAHLLHSLLESDPQVRQVFDGPVLARLLGYLVQRSIGYGLLWQSSVEDSGSVPVVREAGWSPAAAFAMDCARKRSEKRGDPQARGLDLLVALAADTECRAVEVLGRAGVRAEGLESRVEAAEGGGVAGELPP
ncbi:Clp protease N-terminal domain-containing protein [Streptomyces sp. TS71-3]|uniref:Clp protease N-terminal domain-containing protein n=1 Tax=Streptomyces sp. TS71-3 TaxID=2733862 RepID=UPI001B08E4CF|nr:Clp protease N-terminal domain-containing protein [Streptomyces sp. TS71-3]GHJ39029.1 peptidase [Streptomyces sp. TS71-3]